jgi:hypothetical protein
MLTAHFLGSIAEPSDVNVLAPRFAFPRSTLDPAPHVVPSTILTRIIQEPLIEDSLKRIGTDTATAKTRDLPRHFLFRGFESSLLEKFGLTCTSHHTHQDTASLHHLPSYIQPTRYSDRLHSISTSLHEVTMTNRPPPIPNIPNIPNDLTSLHEPTTRTTSPQRQTA